MIRLLLFIFTFLSLFYNFQINAENIIIDKTKKIILNYSNNKILEDLYKNSKLKIYLLDNVGVKIVDDFNTKKVYFEVFSGNYNKKGKIYLYFNKEVSFIDYTINIDSKNLVFDISSRLKYKRIQSRPLSCESAAAADIISYFKNIDVDEYNVYDLMNKDIATIPKYIGDKLIWGDPNKGFVGNITYYGEDNKKPTQSGLTGYGVYEKPVKEVFDKYFIKTSIMNENNHSFAFGPKDHLKLILKNLENGNMVQLWGDWCTKGEYEDGIISKDEFNQEYANQNISGKNECYNVDNDRTISWYYNDNGKLKQHKGLSGEHAFYLLGYEGHIDNPIKIIVWDTYTGYHKYDTIEWMRKWSAMSYRTIIAYNPNNGYLSYNNRK